MLPLLSIVIAGVAGTLPQPKPKLGQPVATAPQHSAPQPATAPQRLDAHVASDLGVSIFVREVRMPGPEPTGEPIVLLHGARVPGVASFDLPVAHGSLAVDLAQGGHRVFVMDARGFGGSTRPATMNGAPDGLPPVVRSDAVMRDIAAVIGWIRARTRHPQVTLIGWATGGHWCGMYATLHPADVGHLVLLDTLYGVDAPQPLVGHGSELEDKAHPGRLAATLGAYTLATAPALKSVFARGLPADEVKATYDPAVVDAYVQAALASDPTSATRRPPSLRAPAGPLEDSFYLATGRQLWDASLVRAPTLIVRGERDFWSRPDDVARLEEQLTHAAKVVTRTLPGAGHCVHLARPERGRDALVQALLEFVSATDTGAP